ncbi:unnamed protein product [Allacma fusca]|uniref:Uncharacterized protein n=1 Tax=Allacma fusca TaxID=39272 RepID=A0A8J2L367_9HEXA|nr:unnamed protein product [Allacma fusca]
MVSSSSVEFVFLFLASACVSLNVSAKVKRSREDVTVPKFYLHSEVIHCKEDSPELFYNEVALPSVTSLSEEGKIFFRVLMDRLESSLAGAEKYQDLEKEWNFLMTVITESFELAVGRIHLAWYDIIDNNDAVKLPWEIRLRRAVLLELFNSLATEYQVLEAVVKAGTKEIVSTLKDYLVDVMEKLGDKIHPEPSPDGKEPTVAQLMERVNRAVTKLEPNFVGKLVEKIIFKIMTPGTATLKSTSTTFLENVMFEITYTIAAYREESESDPYFWFDMTEILKNVNGSVIPSSQDLLELYLTNEDIVINSVIGLLTMDGDEIL